MLKHPNLYRHSKIKIPEKGWGGLRFWKMVWPRVLKGIQKSEVNVLPHPNVVFKAFRNLHIEDVRLVVVCNEPYSQAGISHGLTLSTPYRPENMLPHALSVFLKELKEDVRGRKKRKRVGDLSSWTSRGILLLNTALTVEEGKPNSHTEIGWGLLIHEICSKLSFESETPIAFLLIGYDARNYKGAIWNQHRRSHRCARSPRGRIFKNWATTRSGSSFSTGRSMDAAPTPAKCNSGWRSWPMPCRRPPGPDSARGKSLRRSARVERIHVR